MGPGATVPVESETLSDFARVMRMPEPGAAPPARARVALEPEKVKDGVAQLVLALVKLLHELLERQALRRMDAGSLTAEQVERVGLTLLRQAQVIDRLRQEFGLEEEDLNLDLGPLGKLLR